MKAITGSIVGMLNLPIPIALFVVVVGAWIILPRVVENNAEQAPLKPQVPSLSNSNQSAVTTLPTLFPRLRRTEI